MADGFVRGRSGERVGGHPLDDANTDTNTDLNSNLTHGNGSGVGREGDHYTGDTRIERPKSAASRSHENIGTGVGVGRNMGSSSAEGGGRDTESSADEQTNMMRRSSRNQMGYQGTNNAAVGGGRKGRKPAVRRPQEERNDEDEAADGQGWWAQALSKYGSIELENKGSVARDHLALERTFLAWLRTSLAFASIGIAITQLFRLNVASSSSSPDGDRYARLRSMGKPLGATFLGISIVMLFIGFHRYFESQHWIIRGKFPASRGSIVIVALVTFALMVTSLVVVVVVEPAATEKR